MPDRVLVSRAALAFLFEHFGPDMTGERQAPIQKALDDTVSTQPTCVVPRRSVVMLLDYTSVG